MIRICRFRRSQEIVQGFGVGLRGKFLALCGGELHDAVPALGSAHDAAQGRNIFQLARDHSIRGNHKVFDQLGGAVLLLLHDIDHLFVQHQRMNFVGLKVQRAVLRGAGSLTFARPHPAV